MCDGRESRSNSVGWFWLRGSLEVAAKMLAGLHSSEGLTAARGSDSKFSRVIVGRRPRVLTLWASPKDC